jgi:RNA polymerase sigma factor (sigma-70 family)
MLSTRMVNPAALTYAMTASTECYDSKCSGTSDVEFPAVTASARVAVVDYDERAREALAFQISTAGFRVGSYASAGELLASNDASKFDCLVAEIFLPGMNGLRLQEELRERRNLASVVFITERDDLSLVVRAMKAGAMDVLGKPVDDEALLTAIELGVQRSRARATEHAQRLDLEQRFRSLPPRQREVFTLVTAGLLNKQVAAELGISERTVKVHRERLRRKMGADSLAELSRMASTLQIPARASFAGRK